MIGGAVPRNPYAPDPATTASTELLSGGYGDGQAPHVMTFLLQRAGFRADVAVALDSPVPGTRGFDMAEAVAWAAEAAGSQIALPRTTAELRSRCYAARTMVAPARAMTTKGALLFGGGQLAVAAGLRRRVILADPAYGVWVADADVWRWDEGALIPGVRGYR